MTENIENVGQAPVQDQEKPVEISEINSDDLKPIKGYYKFEVDHNFSKLDERTTLDKMASMRQEQMKNEQLKVFTAKEGNELIATSVVVLNNSPDGQKTMGKEIKENEAFAAGTFVLMDKRGGQIAPDLAKQQEAAAIEAGKTAIITDIDPTNQPSMRFRMNKRGYSLDGVNDEGKEGGQAKYSYRFRKSLDQSQSAQDPTNWADRVKNGEVNVLEGDVNDNSPDEILVDPENIPQIQQLVENNYKGIYQLNPERDFGDQQEKPIEKDLIVFTKEKI